MDETAFRHRLNRELSRCSKFDGMAYRMVAQKYANEHDIISIAGSLFVGGRFNFKGRFGILYTATNVHTCTEEALRAATAKEAEIVANLPRTLIGIRIKLSRVLDLTNSAVRKRLGIKKKLLIQMDWEYEQDVLNQEAVTQVIGRLAREVGFEGILVPSAAWSNGKNLNVYPDKLQPGSVLRPENTDQLALKT